ncbi:hypothetical protein Tco_0403781 [Tanacetum coccineum]
MSATPTPKWELLECGTSLEGSRECLGSMVLGDKERKRVVIRIKELKEKLVAETLNLIEEEFLVAGLLSDPV